MTQPKIDPANRDSKTCATVVSSPQSPCLRQHIPNKDLEHLRTLADVGACVSGSGGGGTLYCKKIAVRFRHPDVVRDLTKRVTVTISATCPPHPAYGSRQCLPGETFGPWASGPNDLGHGLLESLHIELSEDNDPYASPSVFTLLHFDINAAGFGALREEQRLLVDFDSFPTMLIQLLESCEGGLTDSDDEDENILREHYLSSSQKSHNISTTIVEQLPKSQQEGMEQSTDSSRRGVMRPSLSDSSLETTDARAPPAYPLSDSHRPAESGPGGAMTHHAEGSFKTSSGRGLVADGQMFRGGLSHPAVSRGAMSTSLVALIVCDCESSSLTTPRTAYETKMLSSSITSLFWRDTVSVRNREPVDVAGWTTRRDVMGATLCIIETNFFKELTHLSLRFSRADDPALRNHLSKRMGQFKAYSRCLETELKALSLNRLECLNAYHRLRQNWETMYHKFATTRENLRAEFEKEIRILAEGHQTELEEQKKALVEARTLAEAQLNRMLKDVRQERDQCRVQIDDLDRKIGEMSAAHQALSLENESLKRTLAATHREADARKEETAAATNENTELAKECRSLHERIAADQKELTALKERLPRLEESVTQLQAQKQLVEETLTLTRTRETELRDALTKSAEEISKGNEVIQKLQDALKKERLKVKRYQQTTSTEQQNSTAYLEEKLSLTSKIAELESVVRSSQKKEEALKTELEKLKLQLAESEQIIKGHQMTIDKLDTQLNQRIVESVVGTMPGHRPASTRACGEPPSSHDAHSTAPTLMRLTFPSLAVNPMSVTVPVPVKNEWPQVLNQTAPHTSSTILPLPFHKLKDILSPTLTLSGGPQEAPKPTKLSDTHTGAAEPVQTQQPLPHVAHGQSSQQPKPGSPAAKGRKSTGNVKSPLHGKKGDKAKKKPSQRQAHVTPAVEKDSGNRGEGVSPGKLPCEPFNMAPTTPRHPDNGSADVSPTTHSLPGREEPFPLTAADLSFGARRAQLSLESSFLSESVLDEQRGRTEGSSRTAAIRRTASNSSSDSLAYSNSTLESSGVPHFGQRLSKASVVSAAAAQPSTT